MQMEELKQREHGTYTEVRTEKEVMAVTTSSPLCVVHFYHKEFRRCLIMGMLGRHLLRLLILQLPLSLPLLL